MNAPAKLLVLAFAALATAARLTVSVPGSNLLPNPSELPSSTHAVLLGPPGVRYDTPLRRDNTLVFSDIPAASYLLTVHTRDFFFPPLRVDVNRTEGEGGQTISAWQTFRGNEWNNKGPSFGSGKDELNIQIRPNVKKDFYQVRGGFSLLSFLKSPMILMALFSVAMIFGMPYIMENSKLDGLCSLARRVPANRLQWIPSLKPNSKRCRRSRRSWGHKVPRINCRISISLDSLLGDPQRPGQGRVALLEAEERRGSIIGIP